jgi:hypothetical protein
LCWVEVNSSAPSGGGATCPHSNNCSLTFPLNLLFRVSVWLGQAWADFCWPKATYSEGFWRWCDAFRRILLLDFIHRPMFFLTTFRKLALLPSSGKKGGKGWHLLCGVLIKS